MPSDRLLLNRGLVGAVAGTVTAILPAFLMGALAVQARVDLDFGEAGLGLAEGAFFATAALTSIVMGRVAERIGPGRALRVAACLSAVVDIGIAASPTFGWVVVFLAAGGVSNALAQPAANIMVARSTPASHQGLAFGIKQSAMPGAALLGGLAVPSLSLTVGWRWGFVAAAIIAVGAAVVIPRGEEGRRSRRDHVRAGDLALLPLVVLASGVGFGAASAGALAAFVVSGGVEVGLGPAVAGLALTGGSAFGISCRLLAGSRADRRDGGHLRVVALLMLGGAIAVLGLAVGNPQLYLLACLPAFGAGWGWPGLFNLSIVRHNPNAPGAATGITQTGTYIGALTGPLVFGLIAEGASFGWAWCVAGVWFVLAAAAVLAGRALLRRELDQMILESPRSSQ